MPVNPGLWYPPTWSDIAGNSELKGFAHGLVESFRCHNEVHAANALVLGPTGTGKSATLRLALKALLCRQLDAELNPCHDVTCCRRDAVVGRQGLFVGNNDPIVETHYVDCANATSDQLHRIRQLADIGNGPLVIWLDEVHRLQRQQLDEQMLIVMDTTTATWIASSTTLEGLDRPFIERFGIVVESAVPSRVEFILWLAARCKDCGIEVDNEGTLALIADGIECNGRKGLHSLVYAVNRNRRQLTREAAEKYLDSRWLIESQLGPSAR